MNVAAALSAALPGVPVYETRPGVLPRSAFVIVTEVSDGKERQYYAGPSGHAPQVRRLTLLLTLYGEEGRPLSSLRPLYRALRTAGDLITEHPELPPILGAERGAEVPPQPAEGGLNRPWAAARILLTYAE